MEKKEKIRFSSRLYVAKITSSKNVALIFDFTKLTTKND